MVAYIGTARVQELVARLGAADFIEALSSEVEADYRRWDEFEKSPRLASHSERGVIELMPTSDGRLYSFKYVNGHPQNTAGGLLTVTAFGVLADVAQAHGATTAQIALAWLMARSKVMLPIPGTSSIAHLEENTAAVAIELKRAEYDALDRVATRDS